MNDATALIASLGSHLAHVLQEPEGSLDLSLIYQGSLADSTTIFLTRNQHGKPRAVVLCSPPSSPEIVQRTMHRAQESRRCVGPALARRILQPLVQGQVGGVTYAVLPYCHALSNFRPVWWLQRRRLRPVLADWLAQVAQTTAFPPASENIEAQFEKPLAALAGIGAASERLRYTARTTLERLGSGRWSPKHTLMHGDVWKGNLMVRVPGDASTDRWEDRLVLIDWAGARVEGYPVYDVVRALGGFSFDIQSARRELLRHCEILACEPIDLSSHLCAALAHHHAHLEEFPLQSFLKMSEACFDTLQHALP